MIKLKKNTKVTVRINDKIKEALLQDGVTVQKLLDQYIRDNYEVDITSYVRRKEEEYN